MSTPQQRPSKPATESGGVGSSTEARTASPTSSPVMSGQRSAGRIGLSEYTAQRLAELRARRAEAEADFKQGATSAAKDSAIPPPVPSFTATITSASDTQPSTITGTTTSSGLSAKQPTRTSLATRSVVESTPPTIPPSVESVYKMPSADPPTPRRAPLADPPVRPTDPAPSTPSRSTLMSGARDGGSEMSLTPRSHRSPSNEAKLSAARYTPSPSHSSRSGAEDDDEVLGFASLPEQVHRKAVKRGFDFTLMVVGESGLGKSTLISCLFMNNDLYKGRIVTSAGDRIAKTVSIDRKFIDIEERGVRLRLNVVDTPGFNEMVDARECWKPIEEYIDRQYEQYLKDESGINRKNIKDTRVHCCLYFISPYNHGLRQIDIEMMRRLQRKVNLVPVIGKSDALAPSEVKRLKAKIRAEIEKHSIRIYEFPDCDSDEDEEFKGQDAELKAAVPFAVVGSNTIVEVGGKKVRGRLYPWGIVEVDNPNHSDFSKLRQFVISTHMQDLKDVTRDIHYENYRARHIQEQMHKSQKERGKLKRESTPNIDAVAQADELLQRKDQEIQEMREMLKRMETQLAGSNGGSTSTLNQVKGLGNL